MKNAEPLVSTNLTTGEKTTIHVDPRVYTSLHDWKPVKPEKFVRLLHLYGAMDQSLGEYNNGLMTTKGHNLDRGVEVTIHYMPKEEGSPVSMPVLLTLYSRETDQVMTFASVSNGMFSPDDA